MDAWTLYIKCTLRRQTRYGMFFCGEGLIDWFWEGFTAFTRVAIWVHLSRRDRLRFIKLVNLSYSTHRLSFYCKCFIIYRLSENGILSLTNRQFEYAFNCGQICDIELCLHIPRSLHTIIRTHSTYWPTLLHLKKSSSSQTKISICLAQTFETITSTFRCLNFNCNAIRLRTHQHLFDFCPNAQR